jgi:hypothetical protein
MRKNRLSTIFIFPIILFLFFGIFFISSCSDAIETFKYITIEGQGKIVGDSDPPREIEEQIDVAVRDARVEIAEEYMEEMNKEIDELANEILEEELPTEPIYYDGRFEGVAITLIVNFKTFSVSGSVKLSGDAWADAAITGSIDIDTFEVITNFSGMAGIKEAGWEWPFNGTINGIISSDLSTFNGTIIDDEGWGGGGEFTAY